MTPRTIVVVSDIHAGCQLGLCPPGGAMLDSGGSYTPSEIQRKLWTHWREFWDEWVPMVTHREPYVLVVNGDTVDGVHHGSTTQITHNLTDQAAIARAILRPVVEMAHSYYHVRGTEAHVGKAGQEEERLAAELGAVPDGIGNHARWQLWYDLCGHLVHFTHHIGTTGSSSYEATAVGKELVEMYVEAGRWEQRPAQVVVRGHRHRYSEFRLYGARGLQISAVTPAWQMQTPFVFRTAGRNSPPQFGGMIVRAGDEELHTRAKVWTMERPKVEGAE